MNTIAQPIPNFVGGVSQVPEALRDPTKADFSNNTDMSASVGLRKRPPSVYRFTASVPGDGLGGDNLRVHFVERDPSERYLMLMHTQGVRVFNLNSGEQVPVSYEAGTRDYLDTPSPAKDLRVVTVEDYTFIVNRRKVVAADPELSPTARPEALLWVRQGVYGGKYSVTLDGITVAYLTPSRAQTDDESSGNINWLTEANTPTPTPVGYTPTPPRRLPKNLAPDAIATDAIARELFNLLSQNPTLSTRFEFLLSGSMIRIRRIGVNNAQGVPTYSDFTLSVRDSLGDTILRGIKDRVQAFNTLPPVCFPNFRVKVLGDGATEFDDYYLRFDGDLTGGVWVEDIAAGEAFKVDPTTMPHALIRQSDGTFRLSRLPWNPRTAGDSSSAPLPSFVGRRLRDITMHRSRLVMVAGKTVFMSAAGAYFDLFRASATQILDTDPIDVEISHPRASAIHHAVSFDRSLVLFTRDAQFQLKEAETLTEKTVGFDPATSYSCDPDVTPVPAGAALYFSRGLDADNPNHSGVLEYRIEPGSITRSAADITDEVPRYIPGRLTDLVGSSSARRIAAHSPDAPGEVFVYAYSWVSEEKVQSAWTKWTLGGAPTILGIEFIDDVLWMALRRNGFITVETVSLNSMPTTGPLGYQAHIDQLTDQNSCTVEYLSNIDQTRIRAPFAFDPGLVLIALAGNPTVTGQGAFTGYRKGQEVPYSLVEGDMFVSGRIERFLLGRPYVMRHTLSPQFYRRQDRSGQWYSTTSGRLQLQRMSVTFSDTGYFRAEVSLDGGRFEAFEMTARVLGEGDNLVGTAPLRDGSFRFPVPSLASRATVSLVNDTPRPCALLDGGWVGTYTNRARTIG